ncbi:MAG: iron-containing alcohol dehydrogenase [Pseudomonadales bacterium]|nr:iron-containing alcohol dehydrogenase [Pseudomonadales bacterium]
MLSNEEFVVPPLPTIVFNRGAGQKLSDHIQALGKTSALIVTDKNLAASGVLDPILDALKAANLKVEVFDGVEPNPTDLNVEAGTEKLRELGDACVVPIGGGSSMDCGNLSRCSKQILVVLKRCRQALPSLLMHRWLRCQPQRVPDQKLTAPA